MPSLFHTLSNLTKIWLLQEEIANAGSEFSFYFPFNKGRKERDNFQQPEGSMFYPGQAHYCVWWSLGQLVSSLN